MNAWILGRQNILQVLSIKYRPDEWMNAWILGWLNVVLQVLSTEYNLMNEWMHDN